jgi:hypothetical protein
MIAGHHKIWQEAAEARVYRTVAMVQGGQIGVVTLVVILVIQGLGMMIQGVETGLTYLRDPLDFPKRMFLVSFMHKDTAKEVRLVCLGMNRRKNGSEAFGWLSLGPSTPPHSPTHTPKILPMCTSTLSSPPFISCSVKACVRHDCCTYVL